MELNFSYIQITVPAGSLAEDPAEFSAVAITHPDFASLVHPLFAVRKEGLRKRK
jgi:hypothetical protein